MAKKITLKNKNGDVLCPHTAIEQVQGLKEALDDKLGKTEKVSSATNADKLGGYSSSLYLKGTGVLESANFNEQKTVGIYRYNGVSDKNAPSEATAYGNLMVIRSGEHDTLSQLYLNSSNNRIFVRSGSNSDFTSKNWQTIAFTDSNVASASSLTPLTLDHADTTSNAGLTVYQLWTGDEGTDILPNGSMMLNMATNDGVKKQLLFGHPVGSNNNMVIQYRRRAGSWSDWKTVAFTDSTVASVIDGAISTSKIATAAITPAKIQTSIALNGTPSMTVEPTTSSPDKTIASVGLVKKVKPTIFLQTLQPSATEVKEGDIWIIQ